jgi:hypothetical protein
MPIVAFSLLWAGYTLVWYGWINYSFAYANTNAPGLTDLVIPSRAQSVVAAIAENSGPAGGTNPAVGPAGAGTAAIPNATA